MTEKLYVSFLKGLLASGDFSKSKEHKMNEYRKENGIDEEIHSKVHDN